MINNNRRYLVEKSGSLHIYYANKTFKHWKKRWLHLQDQQLSVYQDSHYKRLEYTINIHHYRVSVTNSYDSISHKGYTFKIYNPNSTDGKPIYFSADSQQSMTQWINTLRLSASIVNDLLVEPHYTTDLHSVDTDSESDYDGWMHNNNTSIYENRSYKPTMPVVATSTNNEQTRYLNSHEEEENNIDDNRWYRPHSSSPSYPYSNGVIHQSSSATMGSWGFDVNRSTNGQTPLSFTSHNNTSTTHNNNNTTNTTISDHRTITRTPRRFDESMEDYSERPVDRSSSPPQRFKLRTPTLTKHRDRNDFAVIDRLVLGPSRTVQSDYYPSDESPRQQTYMPSSTNRSRQSSTRSILRRRSKSIGDFTSPTTSTSPPPPPPPPPHLTQSYHQYQYHERPRTSPTNHHRVHAEHELMAWQNRMLERDQRTGTNLITRPSSTNTGRTQSPTRMSNKRGGFNSSQSSNRQMPITTRPISAMSNISSSDHNEVKNKLSKIIKRYIELLYHLQVFYDKVTDQLYGGNVYLRNNLSTQQSVFLQHCRKIAEQLQRSKPLWDRKIVDLQHLLKEVSSYEWSILKSETTFLQRQSTLTNLLQTLNSRQDFDNTQLNILNDVDRVLHEDKLAVQLQDELSTLLQHQSLLNDFSSLLQWNYQIYSPNEQNRVENILPLLREQTTTTAGYVSRVSQQLTGLVTHLRSLEKYILSHIHTIPLLDDGNLPTNRTGWRSYNETDLDTMRTRNPSERIKDEYQRSSRYQTRPLSVHTPTNQPYHQNGSPNHRSNNNYNNESFEWQRRSPSPIKTRSISMTRYTDPSEPVRGPSMDNFDRDEFRSSTKWSPRRTNTHLNTNNSNNNPPPPAPASTTARMATVKSARRDNSTQPNSILKPYPNIRTTLEPKKKDFDIDTIDKEIFKPDKVEIPDRLIDFDNDDQVLTPNERLARMKKKEEVRKMLSKQSAQEMNEHDYNDNDGYTPYNHRRIEKDREKALNLQSALAEEAKEKSRQVAAKHYLNKSYHQQPSRRNS